MQTPHLPARTPAQASEFAAKHNTEMALLEIFDDLARRVGWKRTSGAWTLDDIEQYFPVPGRDASRADMVVLALPNGTAVALTLTARDPAEMLWEARSADGTEKHILLRAEGAHPAEALGVTAEHAAELAAANDMVRQMWPHSTRFAEGRQYHWGGGALSAEDSYHG
jgi:hypothetical protein